MPIGEKNLKNLKVFLTENFTSTHRCVQKQLSEKNGGCEYTQVCMVTRERWTCISISSLHQDSTDVDIHIKAWPGST